MVRSREFDHVRMLLVDNYDSFTYNLVQAFAAHGADVMVYRNDMISIEEALSLEPTHLVISPGPGRPEDAGVSIDMIAAFSSATRTPIPILGVCLGHQCIVQHLGGEIVRAERLMHGKTSQIVHDGKTLFSGISQPFEVGRYHSLCAQNETLPDSLELSAQTNRKEIMGVRHKSLPIEGVQFHPESVLTPEGETLMTNFMRMAYMESGYLDNS